MASAINSMGDSEVPAVPKPNISRIKNKQRRAEAYRQIKVMKRKVMFNLKAYLDFSKSQNRLYLLLFTCTCDICTCTFR